MDNNYNTIILGLGNPLRGDDAAGFHVAERLLGQKESLNCKVVAETTAGLNLCEVLDGYHRAIIVDAFFDPGRAAGSTFWLSLDDLANAAPRFAGHDLHILDALKIGNRLGLHMPEEVRLLAIAINGNTEWSENVSSEVERGIEAAVEQLLESLQPRSN